MSQTPTEISKREINDMSVSTDIIPEDSKKGSNEGKCKKYKKWIIISIVIAVAVIAAVVIAIIIIKKGKKDEEKKPKIIDTTQPPTSPPVEPPTNPPVEPPTNPPVEPPTSPPVEPPTNPPVEPPTNPPVEPTTNPPVEPTTNPPVEPTTNPPIQPTTNPPVEPTTNPPVEPTTNTPEPEGEPLVNEFNITTNENDLYRITVVQNSKDQSKFNNQVISTDVIRKTTYDIIILSQEDAKEEDKLFYNKTYTGAISIANECYTTGEEKDCKPQEMVDLTKIKADPDKLRLLEKDIDLENVPLAICLFNITNNDFITSITCHKDFPDMKKNEMLLDLYFFRSPAIERKNKTRDNITIIMNEDEKNKKKYIREQNGGLCNIYNNWGSLCTTDMNITLDLDGNLLSYDELAITNIIYDKNNSFTKTKSSNLKDHSASITEEDKKNYRKAFDNLYSKMKKYMEEDVQFPREKFVELYNLVKNKSHEGNEFSSAESVPRRRLTSSDAIQYIRKKELFHVDSLGVQVNLDFKINPGLNTNAMSSQLGFSFDDIDYNIYKKDHLSDIQIVIDKLRALSKAGNYLATQLYDKINEKLENLPNEMSIQLRSLYDLLQYYDLFEVFNSTLMTISHEKLPYIIIQISNDLVSKMSGLYLNIERTGNVKKNVEDLVDSVYEFVNNSHSLVDVIYKNLKELSNTLLTKSNPFTQITNYYLNNTSISYVKMVKRARKVFENYFVQEFNLTYPKIEELIAMFEEESKDTLQSDREYILDMYTRLMNGSYQIVGVRQDDFQKVLSNLFNTYNYTSDIIEKIKNFIIRKIDIKDSGYYISKDNIHGRNQTYASIYSEIEKVLEQLNKDDLIDKMFDNIMIRFKEDYIKITKYMSEKKAELFTLEEDTLIGSIFSDEDKHSMELKIIEFTDNILSKVKREVDYKKRAKAYIDQFVNENLDELNELISDLEAILSEETLENLANIFEVSLNKSLNKLSEDIDNNVELTEEYFNHFYNTIYDDSYLINILKDYHVEEIPKIKYFSGWMDFKAFSDEIAYKERTTTYLTKYNQIISMWNYTDKYLKNQLGLEVLEDYKKIFNSIKEILQSMINIESLQNYTDSEDIEFYNTHSQIIETIQTRIDSYFSESIFEAKYSKYVENLKTKYKDIIDDKRKYIKQKHDYILGLPIVFSQVYDFCIVYERKICYGCTNCVWNTFDYGRFCIILTPYENNYLKLIRSVYELVEKNENFNNTLNTLYVSIQERVKRYNSIMKILESGLINLKNEILDNDFDDPTDYLQSYADWIKSLLEGNFGNIIVKSAYNYYYQQIKTKITNLLDDISEKWRNAYKDLFHVLHMNYDQIKYTMYEFGIMGQIYQTILKTDLITNYFDSIILFQKSEFNYTITHYYDYLYRLVNNSYTYVLANFPKDETEYNYIYMKRKNQTLAFFDRILENILISENTAINLENQKAILKVEEVDFFQMNSKIQKAIKDLDVYIDDKIDDIIDLELFHNSLKITQHSLTTRYYLENKEFGKLLEEIYEPLEEGKFFYLNFSNFKDLMTKNWIFDGNDFSNIINDALYESNKEIRSELRVKFEEYSNQIENEIKKYLGKDIEKLISEIYEINIKALKTSQINDIQNIIKDNLKKIKEKIKDDLKKITSKDNNYYTFTEIKNLTEFYKQHIFEKVNNSLVIALNDVYQNMTAKIYKNCIESSLNEYLEIAKQETSKEEFGEFEMLNYTFKIGGIIYNLAKEAVRKYKVKSRKKIYFKYVEYYQKIQSNVDLSNIKKKIKDEIDDIYKNIIVATLNAHNKNVKDKKKTASYTLETAKETEIMNLIDTSVESIKGIISSTKEKKFTHSFKCSFDFTDSGSRVINPICQSFKEILIIENEEQITKINKYIQNTITANLDDYLENVIPTFGNEFFDRIIDYNINFKIIDLYSNLHYALGQLFLYYAALARYRDDVENLPQDLKYRLYRLNDLDYTIKSKKYEIMDLLEEKLSELIENLKDVANDTYTLYIKENKVIQSSFGPRILKAIENNLIEIMPQIKEDYEEALEKYLKEKFLNSFRNSLDEETDKMLTIFKEEKERLITELEGLFSLEIDKDLNEVNRNINSTVHSIRYYYEFMRTYSVPDYLKDFFRLYANTSLVPLFETFRVDLENMTFTLIYEDINNKSKIIEKINITEFLYKCRELMKYFKIDFYDPILKALEDYNTPSYQINLEAQRDKYLNKKELRRLVEGDEDEKTIELKRQESKDVEETFTQLYQLTEKTRSYFLVCFECDHLSKTESFYLLKTSFVYKTISYWIKKNRYSKNIHKFLIGKLDSLYTILIGYYSNVKLGLSEKRIHMMYYMDIIYTKVINTRLITANTLNKKYEEVLAGTKSFNVTYSDNNERDEFYEYKHETEHMINKASASFSGIKEYSEFQFETFLTGGLFKTPSIKARIVDKTRPEKLNLNVRAEYGFCGRTSFIYKVDFNEANYTMTIDYDTKSNNIDIITYTNFDKYNYTSQMYQIPDKYEMDSITYMGYTIYFQKQCYSANNRNLSGIFINEVEAKNYSETMIIVG